MDHSHSQPNNIQTLKPIKPISTQQRSSLHQNTKDKNKEVAEEDSGQAVAKAKEVSCSTTPHIETSNAFDVLSLLPEDDMCQGS